MTKDVKHVSHILQFDFYPNGIAIRANELGVKIFLKRFFPSTKSRGDIYLSQGNILHTHKCLNYNNFLSLYNLHLPPTYLEACTSRWEIRDTGLCS